MDVETKLTYLQWQPEYSSSRPYRIAQFGRKRTNNQQPKPHNLVFHKPDRTETIKDIRGCTGKEFTLETNGFVYARYPPPVFTEPKEFASTEQVQSVFLPECEEILRKEIPNIDQVFIFDCKVCMDTDFSAYSPLTPACRSEKRRVQRSVEKETTTY